MKPRFQKPGNGGRRSRRTITKRQIKQANTATPEAKKKRVAIPAAPIGRSVLPIPDRPPIGLTTYDAKDPDTQYPPIEPLRPPTGAPNVLIVLIDDAGFGASSAFGGPCQTPTFERLAKGGLKYNRFH